MTFKERGKLILTISGWGACIMLVIAVIGTIVAGPNNAPVRQERHERQKTDAEYIREGQQSLKNYCQVNPDECAGN